MGLDIRWPIGLMFSLIGALLAGYGALTNSNVDLYQGSLGINVNLWWGLLLLVFGGFMLAMAIRGAKTARADRAAAAGKTAPPDSQKP